MICLGQKDCSKVHQVCQVSKMKGGMLVTCTWLVAWASFDVPPAARLMAPLPCTERKLSVRRNCPKGCNLGQRQLVRHAACLSQGACDSHRPPCSLSVQLATALWLCTWNGCFVHPLNTPSFGCLSAYTGLLPSTTTCSWQEEAAHMRAAIHTTACQAVPFPTHQ